MPITSRGSVATPATGVKQGAKGVAGHFGVLGFSEFEDGAQEGRSSSLIFLPPGRHDRSNNRGSPVMAEPAELSKTSSSWEGRCIAQAF
jgi:hypothetical protein